jgi:hypothetical protein
MKRFGKALLQRLREISYLLLSFPTSIFFFVIVMDLAAIVFFLWESRFSYYYSAPWST